MPRMSSAIWSAILKLVAVVAVCMTYSYMIVRDLSKNDSIKDRKISRKTTREREAESKIRQLFSYDEARTTDGFKSKYIEYEIKNPKFVRYLRVAYIFSMLIHATMLIKYIILCLLTTNKSLQSYGWIDCYILGRFALTPRLSRASKFVALFLTFFHFLWRLVMTLRLPRIRLEWAEFLQYSYDDVLFEEVKAKSQRMRSREDNIGLGAKLCRKSITVEPSRSRIFYTGTIFNQHQPVVIRPNRTVQGRLYLTRFIIFYWSLAGIIITSLVSFLVITMTPTCFTQFGFEQSYDVCVSWIINQVKIDNRSSRDYAHIYTARREMVDIEITRDWFVLPWTELRPYNSYNIMKLIFDYVDNIVIWFDTIVAFADYTFVGMIVCIDIVIYFVSLRNRLRRLKRRLSQTYEPWLYREKPLLSQVETDNEEVHIIQVLTVDYFMQIDKYNAFANFYTQFVLLLWISYTFCFCSWFVESEWHIILEWYAIEVISTLFVILIICTFGVIDSFSRQLHSLITVAMALDSNITHSKKRWMRILDYYSLTPIFCFRLFSSYKISIFLCLQVS